MGLNCTNPGGCRFPKGGMCLASCSFTSGPADANPSMDPQRQRELADPSHAAFEAAMRQTFEMVDPFNPPKGGTYARGTHEGICAALKTMRENYERERRKRTRAAQEDAHPSTGGMPREQVREVPRG